MILKGKYLHAHSHLPTIPRSRLITGIFVGLLFSFCFYSFLYVCRETLRVLFFITEDFDLLILSDAAVSLFNLIQAYIATILGQSLCFIYCFETPLAQLGKYAPRMRAVINDQRSMNTYFLSWFSRLTFVFMLLIGAVSSEGIYVMQTFSRYSYVFALIIIVLFLHTWINLRRLFNGKSFRWMLVSAAILSILSLGLSRINLIDYKAINKIITSKSVYHSYRLQLPEASCYEPMNTKGRRRATLWIAEDSNKTIKIEPIIIVSHPGMREYNKQIPIDSLKEYFACWDEDARGIIMHEPSILYIHRDVKMGYINRVRKILAELEAYRIQYAVLPPVREYDEKYYTDLAIPLVTGRHLVENKVWRELQQDLNTVNSVFELHITEGGEISIDNTAIGREAFNDFIHQTIQSTPNYCIKYYIEDASTYADYIFVVSNIMQEIHQIRDEYSQRTYQTEYEKLDWEQEKEVRKKFPYRVVEILYRENRDVNL